MCGCAVSVLFWLSIALWLASLVCYALILSAGEHRQRRVARTPAYVPLDALFDRVRYARASKYLYRTLALAASGAMLSGAMYLLFDV